MSDSDLEKPTPDVEDQQHDVVADTESPQEPPASLPFDANEADAADQQREVRLDEDDYR